MIRYVGVGCLLLGMLLLGYEALSGEPFPLIRTGAAVLLLLGAVLLFVGAKKGSK